MSLSTKAVAYYRTSSATNVGDDKDSVPRQRSACIDYAVANHLDIEEEFYDAAVSGADPVTERDGFVAMLSYCAEHDVKVILIETANRFARDMFVQLAGHRLLKDRGIDLIPTDAPTHFTSEDPMSVAIAQIIGVISQLEKAMTVAKLKAARDRKREKTGRCEGRPPAPEAHRLYARKLKDMNPNITLRAIATELAHAHMFAPSGAVYGPSSIKAMLK